MLDDDINSVTLNIPVPRVCAKTSKYVIKPSSYIKRIKRLIDKPMEKPSDTTLTKYSLVGNKPMLIKNVKREELLLPYKRYAAKQKSAKHKQQLNISLEDKYKIVNADLRKRLYVERPCNDVHAITDLDKDFYGYVNGRPATKHVPVFKSLRAVINDQLRMRQEIGYRNDAILNIEVNFKKELQVYDKSFQKCMEQAKYFDVYISEDYKNSMALLKKWDELSIKINMIISELENFASEQFTIRSRLMGLDYRYSIQQKYGRFLYYLSPPSWRAKNREFARSVEIEAKGFDLGGSEEETFAVVFEKMQNECVRKFVSPVLYFSDPGELVEILNSIENQQLHHFTYVTHLAPLMKAVNEELSVLRDLVIQDSAFLATTIKSYKNLVENCEEKETELKTKFYKILNGYFYENVGAPEVLKLILHLEFCYEKVYFEKPTNLNIAYMAKGLEKMYMKYSKALEALHSETIKKAVSMYLQTERQKVKRAKIAKRELQSFNRLEKNLLRAFAPLPNKNKNRSVDVTKVLPMIKYPVAKVQGERHSKVKTGKGTRTSLSEFEMEYLTLFTDWTDNEDPANYLHLELHI